MFQTHDKTPFLVWKNKDGDDGMKDTILEKNCLMLSARTDDKIRFAEFEPAKPPKRLDGRRESRALAWPDCISRLGMALRPGYLRLAGEGASA